VQSNEVLLGNFEMNEKAGLLCRWNMALVVMMMAWGPIPSALARPVQAGDGAKPAKAVKAVKAVQSKAAAKAAPARAKGVVLASSKVAPPLNVKIRPAQVRVVPTPPAREPVLLPVAIEEEAAPPRTSKAVPLRAYARDGASFYQNGQLIRVQGLADAGGEHAKQRLQQLLDGGQISVLPVDGATGGEMLAVVRVNGRDLAEAMANN
jgi:hypothetical protein